MTMWEIPEMTAWTELPDDILEDVEHEDADCTSVFCDNCGAEIAEGKLCSWIQEAGLDLVFCDEECAVSYCNEHLIESGVL